MATVPPAPTLPCKDCGFVNEPERVYCHSCGAKLDRSLLPKEDQIRREPPERARRRIMRMTNPGQGAIKRAIWNFIKTMIFASLAACVILAVKEPADVPPAKGELSTFMSGEFQDFMASPKPLVRAFTQGELNAFLASGKSKKESAVPGVEYKRSFVSLEPGVCRVTMEKAVWGHSIYVSTLIQAEVNAGVFIATNKGGAIGRLPIHPKLMNSLAPFFFRDLREGLKPEIEALRKANGLRIDKEKVVIASKGTAKP